MFGEMIAGYLSNFVELIATKNGWVCALCKTISRFLNMALFEGFIFSTAIRKENLSP